MDTSSPNITFASDGTCHHCTAHLRILDEVMGDISGRAIALERFVDQARREGRGRDYDVVIGLSGGVDSSYVAVLCRDLGLRPIAVHMDNGWNTPESVHNIEQILRSLSIDLVTQVVDWNVFRGVHRAFLQASTPDAEIPTDHAISAVLWETAQRFGIRFVVSGVNQQTEGLLPREWSQGYNDWKYIRSVYERFNGHALRDFPHFTPARLMYVKHVRRIERIDILNYVDYHKENARALLMKNYGWRDYGGKHHESIFTRFFQAVVLPTKFGFDKRRAHLSNLILSGQLSRADATRALMLPACAPETAERDARFVRKKLRLTEADFAAIMAAPPRTILDYPSYESSGLFRTLRRAYSSVRR